MNFKSFIVWTILGFVLYNYLSAYLVDYASAQIKAQVEEQIPQDCNIAEWKFFRVGFSDFELYAIVHCPDRPAPYNVVFIQGTISCHLTPKKPFFTCESNVVVEPAGQSS